MVKVCQTCGDIGFSNAFLHCEKCQVPQHRYCSEKLTFHEDVTWICEDCAPRAAKQSIPVPSRKSEAESRLMLKKKIYGITLSTDLREEKRSDRPFSQSGVVQREDSLIKCAWLATDCSLSEENKAKRSRVVQDTPCIMSDHTTYVPARPIIDSVWSGGFYICNKSIGIIEGLTAHLSNKACLRVLEEASVLPALLCLEKLPRSDVWPKSFELSQPTDESIALYFFPGDKGYIKAYDCLVDEMATEELALRAVVEKAELLVFTSLELPLRYWRFMGRLYLWGVFKGKQASSFSQRLYPFSNQDPDQDLDSAKTKAWNPRSPLSPLSNSGSCGEHEHRAWKEFEIDY